MAIFRKTDSCTPLYPFPRLDMGAGKERVRRGACNAPSRACELAYIGSD